MRCNDWTFEHAAREVAAAAHSKAQYHQERLAYWKQKREEVIATIRAEGIEVDEKIVLAFQNPKSRDWDRAGQVLIRNDLQQDLHEIYAKLSEHTSALNEYLAWESVLSAHPEDRLALDIHDWQHFFGRN